MSSMKDVAKLAGVSSSTVSRVISQKIPVDEQTKKRVQAAIEKLNYRPNLLAKGLRLKSGRLIGLVVPDLDPIHTFANIIKYAEESTAKYDYDLLIGNNRNSPDIEERFIEKLIMRNVNGIIFSRVSDESRVLKILDKRNIPIVAIDRVLEDESVPSVVVNNYRAGELAAEHFVQLGHQNVACITGPLNIGLCRERVKGFEHVLKNQGIAFDERYLYEGNFKLDAGMKGIKTLLRAHQDITGLWVHNDIMAAGVVKELYKRGMKAPDTISIIGMDDSGLASIMTPELTTIKQPFDKMIERAVEMILMQKDGVVMANRKIVLEPTLIVRETTAHVK